jgi:hypothetical protein
VRGEDGVRVQGAGTDTFATAFDASDGAVSSALDIGSNDISGANFSVNGATGAVGATSYQGDGSALTGVASAASFTAHVGAGSGMHGVTGSIVGTSDSQTLSNKSLTQLNIGDFSNAGHSHQNATGGGQLGGSALSDVDGAFVLTAVSPGVA